MELAKIDPNFASEKTEKALRFYPVPGEPFRVEGLLYNETDGFHRLPRELAVSVSEGVGNLYRRCAGGRLHFRTDSASVTLHCTLTHLGHSTHMAALNYAGFDLYFRNADGKWQYRNAFRPENNTEEEETMTVSFPEKEMRELLIEFPNYGHIHTLEVGLEPEALLLPAPDYPNPGRIVFYGSSITQGACATRPGNSYESMLCRELDIDYLNLGLSGNAKAEIPIVEYIAKLPMRVLVMDYDHNTPDPEYLALTHPRMYHMIREARPELPIVMATAPKPHLTEVFRKRREIIMRTYCSAVEAGDQRVWFVDGNAMFPPDAAESCLIDLAHPSDLGFWFMSRAFLRPVTEALQCSKNANSPF